MNYKKQETKFFESIKGISNRKAQARLHYIGFEKVFYKLNITTGFIVGVVIDQVIFGTFGYPIKLLKKYGRVWYQSELRHRLVYKVLDMKFLGSFVRGFLE